ncbi:MAG: pilus assembly protein PilM, partial [Lachnospiraceae bacterium]|nr:pilus assembly protein PilM [Lachnospiraceae bacterium]
MAGKVLSISLGSEIVKVCEVALAGKRKIQVFNAIDLIIPEGLCEDGVILDAEALANAIKQGLAGEGFSSKRIVFTITSKRIANKEAIIPYCKENRIRDIVQINASEYFPITNLENYSFNYSILEVVQTDNIKNYRLSITATPNELIEQYYALAKAMGMSVETIDFSGNSILQLLKLQNAGQGVDAVLQIGGENTVVNIMNGSTMVMQRSVPYGRLALADGVKTARDITDEEADMVLINEDIGGLADRYQDVADAVRSMLSSIGRILEFYRARNADHPIERVFIIGDVTSVKGLPDLFNKEMDYDVQLVESLRGVEIKNRHYLSDEIVSNYLANIGAVIDPMRISAATDKKAAEKDKGESMPWWILIIAAVLAIVLCGVILFLYYTAANERDNLQAQIAALGDVGDYETRYNEAKNDLATLQTWYDTTKSANESLSRFFADLEEVMPKEIAITKFTTHGGQVTIEGTSYGKPPVAEFVIQLKKLPYVDSVKMDVITESIEDLSAKDAFTLTLQLQYDDPHKEETVEEESSSEESQDNNGEGTSELTDNTEEASPNEESSSEEN